MSNAHYLIHRVNLDLQAPDLRTAKQLQDEAARIFYHWILPQLEDWLDRLVPKDLFIRLDTLTLDLDRLDISGFEEDFSGSLLRAFRDQVERLVAEQIGASTSRQQTEQPKPAQISYSAEERIWEAFLFFLKTGRQPWWGGNAPELLNEESLAWIFLSLPSAGVEQLISLFRAEDRAVERLLLQYSPAFIRQILAVLFRGRSQVEQADILVSLSELLNISVDSETRPSPATAHVQRDLLREIIQRLMAGEDPFTPGKLEEIQLNISNPPLAREKVKPSPEHNTTGQSAKAAEEKVLEGKEGGIYVQHAGLVLLHPFLEYFFKEFGLLDNGEFKDNESETLAVHLLHYLASGEEAPPEYLLTLEKFLCGLDLDLPVERFIHLSDSMKEESEKLLKAAIGHWRALKNTSPAGLREGFLQRSGKLIQNDFENRLVIEQKAHDVLLSYLPWGYGIIKLPWLGRPLFVDWIV